jgi:transmembrane sensor
MEDNRLWFLIARQLSGEVTVAESNELQELLRRHPEEQQLFEILHSYFVFYADSERKEGDTSIDYEEKFRRIIEFKPRPEDFGSSPTSKPRISPPFSRWWHFAAAVAGIISLASLTYYYIHRQKSIVENNANKTNEVFSKSGARTKLMLPDGSQVWLNSGSKLNYSNDYGTNLREVDLEGEAFFDVTRDVKHPFIVHVSSVNIKVVGTAFDVKSYPQDATVETTLLRGIIEVSRKDNPNGPKVILKPNEKLIIDKQLEVQVQHYANQIANSRKSSTIGNISVTAISKAIPDSNKVETSWVYNRLVFDGDSFEELAEKMERWYNVKISFADRELVHYRFKGAFANETINEALNALQLTAPFSYQINNSEINLFKK